MSPLHQTLAHTLDSRRSWLAEAITARHYEANPELTGKYGTAGRSKCLQDAEYHLSYLAEAIAAGSPNLFADYIEWAKVMLGARHVPASDLAQSLIIMGEAIREELSPELEVLADEFIDAGLAKLPAVPTELATLFQKNAPHVELARNYLRALLGGERHIAGQLVLEAIDSGVSPKEIYLHVFQSSQREIGRLWQMNQVTVAQEHYCTSATQLIMAQLYPKIFRCEKNGRLMVATSIAGELHEIGVRIVTDFFEMEGWDTYYLGANCPTPSILQALSERKAGVLAVSATMTFHIRAVENLITAVRDNRELRDVKILVGGYPFNIEPELWQRIGADACAADASEAVAVAEQL